MATKLEGGGGKALVAGPLKKKPFCGFPYRCLVELRSLQGRSAILPANHSRTEQYVQHKGINSWFTEIHKKPMKKKCFKERQWQRQRQRQMSFICPVIPALNSNFTEIRNKFKEKKVWKREWNFVLMIRTTLVILGIKGISKKTEREWLKCVFYLRETKRDWARVVLDKEREREKDGDSEKDNFKEIEAKPYRVFVSEEVQFKLIWLR